NSGTAQVLFAYDAKQNQLGQGSPSMAIDVSAGATYFVKVSQSRGFNSGYGLVLGTSIQPLQPTPVPPANRSGTLLQGTLPPSGTIQAGSIGAPGQVDLFSFRAVATGRLTIEQDAAPGGLLDSDLSVRDTFGALIAHNDDGGGSNDLDSRATV